jgi:hypothetical protein
MEHAIETSPRTASPYLYLSQASRALGRLDQAKAALETFTRLNRQRMEQRDREVERNYLE